MSAVSSSALTQAQIDAGKVSNTASASGVYGAGQTVEAQPFTATVNLPAAVNGISIETRVNGRILNSGDAFKPSKGNSFSGYSKSLILCRFGDRSLG